MDAVNAQLEHATDALAPEAITAATLQIPPASLHFSTKAHPLAPSCGPSRDTCGTHLLLTPRIQGSLSWHGFGNRPRLGCGERSIPPGCTGETSWTITQSDGNRRGNSPNTAGQVGPAGPERSKISGLDQPLPVESLPLPV